MIKSIFICIGCEKKNHIQQKDFECSYVVDFVDKWIMKWYEGVKKIWKKKQKIYKFKYFDHNNVTKNMFWSINFIIQIYIDLVNSDIHIPLIFWMNKIICSNLAANKFSLRSLLCFFYSWILFDIIRVFFVSELSFFSLW